MKAAGGLLAALFLQVATGAAALEADQVRQRERQDEAAGRLEATVDGQRVALPTLKLAVDAHVSGDLATVTVVQTFINPFDAPVHATYLFPLHERAAVYEMIMEVGDERVRARIKEKSAAVKTFEQAKAAGKAASLLTEHRPNMFTQNVANLMPGLPIRIELKYVHTVERQDGRYRLAVPLVVGPRFHPPQSLATGAAPPVATSAYPPTHIERERVSLRVRLAGGMPVGDVRSDTHAVVARITDKGGKGEPLGYEVTLAAQKIVDNRDFVLTYRLGGPRTTTGLLAYRDQRGGFFSLLIEPPPLPTPTEIAPREMVFLLDCSGSMHGLPMDASKAFMRRALRQLRPTDSFRIIRFSDGATEFAAAPLTATPEAVARGLAYVDGLDGEGGTMMTTGVLQALSVPPLPGTVRLVTLLTDGYIGNEAEVLALVQQHLGGARLFAFGVGTGVNRFLLEKLGKLGRGFTRYMDPTEAVDDVAAELAIRLDAPVLTDIAVDWGGMAPDSMAPARIPDLFAGGSVRIQGHYDRPGTYTIKVTGKLGGEMASLPLRVTLPAATADGEGVALIWARATIDELMDAYATPEPLREPRLVDDDLRQLVTELGLEFNLITRWTSFVAVSERVYNERPAGTPTKDVPLPPVKGVSARAYAPSAAGELAWSEGVSTSQLVADGGFSGSSAPEPGPLVGLLLMALLGAVCLGVRMPRVVSAMKDKV